jgi:hypothetical protein
MNNNQTTLWDGSNKQPSIGNDIKYQTIIKMINTSKETMNNSILSFQIIVKLISFV